MKKKKKILKEVKVPRQKLFDNPSHYVEKGANIEYFFKKETISGIIKSSYQENEKKTVWVIVDGDTTRTELKYIKKIKDYEFI